MTDIPSWRDLMALMRLTLNAPRQGAAEILRDIPSREALWLMFAIVVVLTVLAGEVATVLIAGPALSVYSLLALQAGVFLLVVAVTHYLGRAFGGVGKFDGALILITWLQFIFIFVQIAQVLIFLILPPAALLVAVLSVGLFLWLLVNFVAELHGFNSLGRVLMAVLGVLLTIYVIFVIFAGALGIDVQPGQV